MTFILIGYSQLVVSLGNMSVLLMLACHSMAAPTVQTSTGKADGRRFIPSKRYMASFTYSNLIQLANLVGRIQADFVSKIRTKLLNLNSIINIVFNPPFYKRFKTPILLNTLRAFSKL